MDFFSIVFFLVLYYIRPHEWLSWVAALRPIALCMGLGIFSMFNREKGFVLKDLFKTPHDWMMLLYFFWIVFSAPRPWEAFGNCYNLFIFYFVTVQALSTIQRLQKFLTWWTFLILGISVLALASEIGFDPTGSYDLTHGPMQNRLALNTSLFNNPNALGHSVVPCLMMLYYVCYWKRPIFSKIAAIPLMVLPIYCIYLTVSKGSFVSAFASIVLAYSFGRPKIAQITIVVLAVTIGYGALYSLPRMNELKKGRTDPAIQGRIAAWQFGLDTMKRSNTGVGLGNFMQEFSKRHRYTKAGHSSYVQVGTELGYTGLFFYLGIMYCGIRTLVFAKTTNPAEERARRIMFVILCSYIVSSWMVDFGLRTTYFLCIASIAAFHRQMLAKASPVAETPALSDPELEPVTIGFPRLRPLGAGPAAVAQAMNQISIVVPVAPAPKPGETAMEPPERGGIKWNRVNVIDIVIMILLVWAAVEFWRYAMHHI